MTEQSWTERPHWVVLERSADERPTCVAHYEKRADARAHVARGHANGRRLWIERTA